MDWATFVIGIASLVTAKATGLLALWLRLRWRERHELARQNCLADAVKIVAAGGRVEFTTRSGDGHHLTMRIDGGAVAYEGREAA
ncbi:hypothetical protein [Streptomyces sp. NPDC006309]|uniref:hypothetical protein n=1 Tax=Streptomyces sp. NPDC006309 TaxID=3156749 RepID=UPI0033B48F9A